MAGALADVVGYPVVFGVAGMLALAGLTLALRVREPRMAITVEVVGQPGVLP